MDKDATRYGAVETRDEGRIYAKWLKSHEGEYDGVILCMPIFVDENGALLDFGMCGKVNTLVKENWHIKGLKKLITFPERIETEI